MCPCEPNKECAVFIPREFTNLVCGQMEPLQALFLNTAMPLKVSVCIFYLLFPAGILAEQYAANGPAFHLYNSVEKQWDDLMNWQHSTMYLFFGMTGAVSLVIHTTDAAPLALDRLMLALAFFTEGRKTHNAS